MNLTLTKHALTFDRLRRRRNSWRQKDRRGRLCQHSLVQQNPRDNNTAVWMTSLSQPVTYMQTQSDIQTDRQTDRQIVTDRQTCNSTAMWFRNY